MRLFDVTRTVQEAPVYPGSAPVSIRRVTDRANGDEFTVSQINAGSHMGSHADAFSHVGGPDIGIDQMPLSHYIGPCRLISTAQNALIEPKDLGDLSGVERLALHTGGHSYLSERAARAIAGADIVCVLTDAWSVAPLDNEVAVHTALLGAGVAVVENLVFDGVADGEYFLCAAPIKYAGADGAPVRAVLMKEEVR
ncbi:MAG: cyclase family protein [Clostridia bacterium]|nr:cyclase family protein [Clostridia bacterium]